MKSTLPILLFLLAGCSVLSAETIAAGDAAIGGGLQVGEDVDVMGDSIVVGRDTEAAPPEDVGAALRYFAPPSPEAAELNFLGYRDAHAWTWESGARSGDPVLRMRLDESGRLTLYGSLGGVGLSLDPEEPSVRVGGRAVLLEGENAVISGSHATAIGRNSEAAGAYSFAGGENTVAKRSSSFVFGNGSRVEAAYSAAFGKANWISDEADGSFAAGRENFVEDEERYAAVFGFANQVWGGGAVIGGIANTGDTASAVFGQMNFAGSYGFAAGYGHTVQGYAAAALNWLNVATGNYSTALGHHTTADAYASLVLGRHNLAGGEKWDWVETDPLFEIGIGEDDQNAANAVTVQKNGRTVLRNKFWDEHDPAAVPADPDAGTQEDEASAGDALVVRGHTRLEGRVVLAQPLGDISMGAFGNQ